ncbi:hypothetical protein FRC19_004039 [Serendipita sp. 401]|nr:hypothetical protein FRC19_004039 [Serendipita sp. 401]KAG9044588.1 hypothetical protein FS842_001449 [Serendipita sp. 407]
MQTRLLFWLLATSIYIANALPTGEKPNTKSANTVVSSKNTGTLCSKHRKREGVHVCKVKYDGKEVEIKGEPAGVPSIFTVTEAHGFPSGKRQNCV